MPTLLDLFRADYDMLLSSYARHLPTDVGVPSCEDAWTNIATIVELLGLDAYLQAGAVDAQGALECLRGNPLARPYYDKYLVLLHAHGPAVVPYLARMYYLAKKAQQ